MSKNTSNQARLLALNVQKMDPVERQQIYGVELNEDGSVVDLVDEVEFSDWFHWAEYYIEQNQSSGTTFIKRSGRSMYDEGD